MVTIKAPKLNADVRTWGGPAPTTVAEQDLADDFSRIGQSFPPLAGSGFRGAGFLGFLV